MIKIKQTIFFFVLLASYTIHSQINFESGYFIKNNGEKVTCLIKNLDWRNNPTQFEYKTTTDNPVEIATINSVSMFVIVGKSKYLRATVNIDRSKKQIQLLSTHKEPDFKEEVLFLKTIVEGNANLYYYENRNLIRFFFNLKNKEIAPLVYKKYRKSFQNNSDQVLENNTFRKQLWDNLKCEDLSLEGTRNIDYDIKELTKHFIKYNSCINPNYVESKNNERNKTLINLRVRPGVISSSFNFRKNSDSSRDIDFGNDLNFRIGLELEFVLPFNANKWSLFIEPSYQSYNVEEDVSLFINSLLTINSAASVDYQSIEFPIGLRHYFFLNKKSSIFLNAAFVLDFPINSDVDFENEVGNVTQDQEIINSNNIALGLGYGYNKFNFEIRYGINRQILDTLVNDASDFNSFSFIFGYNLF